MKSVIKKIMKKIKNIKRARNEERIESQILREK